uniref:C2H2-type domain-containing protein n=1 Tax=Lutzomyia longipalpis TaxID=7200 RepID=A0A1B0CY14_LUTLO
MEFQEKVCRTRLNSGFPLSSLNVKLEDQMQGRKMLEFLLGSTIDACETFSEICEPCRKKLIFCYTFKIQCLSSEEKIKQYTKVVEVVLPDPLGVNSEEVPLLIPKVEIEEEEDHQEAFEDSTNVGPEELPLRVPEEQLFEQRQAKKKTYRCGRCDIRFPDKQGYNKHFYREHFRRASTVKSNVLPRVKPAVPVATLREPLVQLREVETRKYRRCKKCNIGFPDKRSYNRHFYREHYCKGKARRAYTRLSSELSTVKHF